MSDVLAAAIECERVFFVSSDGGPNESISGEIGRGQIGTIMCVPVTKDYDWLWSLISMIDPELLELIKCILVACVCLPIIFFLFAFASELDEDMDDELSPLDKRREMRSRFVRESSSDEDETSDPVLKMFTKKTNIPTNVRLGPSQKWRYS
jgi:hypothetical protein